MDEDPSSKLAISPVNPNGELKMSQKVITYKELAKHNTLKDCWILIDSKVYDVTYFLEEHPGGPDVILDSAGTDASKQFSSIGHSPAALKLRSNWEIGVIEDLRDEYEKYSVKIEIRDD